MTEHTTTPWKSWEDPFTARLHIEGDSTQIAVMSSELEMLDPEDSSPDEREQARNTVDANAEFLIRAVNCHHELLAALKQTLDALYNETTKSNSVWISTTKHMASAAIAKAEGKVTQ